jgi:nitrous oxide reductase
MCSEKKQHA